MAPRTELLFIFESQVIIGLAVAYLVFRRLTRRLGEDSLDLGQFWRMVMRFAVSLSACIVAVMFGLYVLAHGKETTAASPGESAKGNFKVEVWGDNWFAFYLGDTLIKEDSVPITTERSFNSETFIFDGKYPLQVNIVAKDFKENDTGLEYIGSRRQQMGDGGIIAQITDLSTGKVVAVTNRNWKALVVHKAPLDAECANLSEPVAGEGPCGFEAIAEPKGWKKATFRDNSWGTATEHSERAVRPKDGYDKISWDLSARIIWGADLEKDNTILLRHTVSAP